MRRATILLLLGGCATSGSETSVIGAEGPRQPTPVTSLVYSSSGRLLLSADPRNAVRVWDAEKGRLLWESAPLLEGRATPVFSPDASNVALLDGGERVPVFPLQDGRGGRVISAGHPIRTAAFLPRGDALVTAGEGRRVECWDLATGEARWMVDESHFPMRQVLVSPDGSMVVCRVSGGKLSFRDARDGSLLFSPPGIIPTDIPVAFLPDGRLAVLSSHPLVTWDPRTGRSETVSDWMTTPGIAPGVAPRRATSLIAPFMVGKLSRGDVFALSPDASCLARAGYAGILRIFREGDPAERFGRFPGGARNLALSSDGSRVAARALGDRFVRVWETKTPDRSLWLDTLITEERRFPRRDPQPTDEKLGFSAPDTLCLDVGAVRRSWTLSAGPGGALAARPNEDAVLPPSEEPVRPGGPGTLIVTTREGRAYTLKAPPAAAFRRGRVLSTVLAGERLFLLAARDRLIVFDLESQAPLRALEIDGDSLSELIPWPSAGRFAAGTREGDILLCDVEKGVLARYPGHGGEILALAVSADGLTLVSSGIDETVRVRRLPR